jgi:hypothetical protein
VKKARFCRQRLEPGLGVRSKRDNFPLRAVYSTGESRLRLFWTVASLPPAKDTTLAGDFADHPMKIRQAASAP